MLLLLTKIRKCGESGCLVIDVGKQILIILQKYISESPRLLFSTSSVLTMLLRRSVVVLFQ